MNSIVLHEDINTQTCSAISGNQSKFNPWFKFQCNEFWSWICILSLEKAEFDLDRQAHPHTAYKQLFSIWIFQIFEKPFTFLTCTYMDIDVYLFNYQIKLSSLNPGYTRKWKIQRQQLFFAPLISEWFVFSVNALCKIMVWCLLWSIS